jgi:hypothetical protein
MPLPDFSGAWHISYYLSLTGAGIIISQDSFGAAGITIQIGAKPPGLPQEGKPPKKIPFPEAEIIITK